MNEKSQLEELIDKAKELLYEESDGSFIPVETARDMFEGFIRLAVQKHAEAIIPEEREMKVPVSFDEYSSYLASGIVNILREGMQKRSDEFRGV